MKQKMRSLLLFIVLIIFVVTLSLAGLLVGQGITAFAYSSDNYSNIEDCFEEDSVIITLTEDETKKFKTYTVDDFKEVGCVEIEDLTKFTANYVKKTARGDYGGESMLVEAENYKRILKLTLKKSGTDNVINAIETLNKRKDVLVAGPNYVYTINATPNDALFRDDIMWGLNDTEGIHAESAWDITTGSNTVTVGVLDTGIQADHPDLKNRISTEGLHRDFTANAEKTVSNTDLSDLNGHGTHVAGIIGAQGNNSTGISGVCWDIRLVSLRVLDENGNGSTADVARAIDFAASKNIPILNYSGGGPNFDINEQNALKNYTGLFVCSAGNNGIDNDKTPHYPSDYSYNQTFSDRVISVGSINNVGKRASNSNYGEKSVSIYAPGVSILSTYPQNLCTGSRVTVNGIPHFECEGEAIYKNGTWVWEPNNSNHYAVWYHYMSGTSMATPFVTGVAALLLSKDPNFTAAELKKCILDTADDIQISVPSSSDPQDVKKLNACNALKSYKVTFDKQGGQGGDDYVYVNYFEAMPAATAPTRAGYEFLGYFSEDGGRYYNPSMKSFRQWDKKEDATLYAQWSQITYEITFKIEGDTTGEYTFTERVNYGEQWPRIVMPTRQGYYVYNYCYIDDNGAEHRYYDKYGQPVYDKFYLTEDITLYGTWSPEYYTVAVSRYHFDVGVTQVDRYMDVRFDQTYTLTAEPSMTGYSDYFRREETRLFTMWTIILRGEAYYDQNTNPWYTLSTDLTITFTLNEIVEKYYPNFTYYGFLQIRAVYSDSPKSCVAEGTLITLADGEQVPVEMLTGDETLLVWNLFTGTFDTAPILCVDRDSLGTYEVINLYFSDDTQVKVISEHGFWDFDLNKYVYLDRNASEYIGHWFNKQITDDTGNFAWERVQLTDVIIQEEYTTAWSPVTYSHLCYYVNGMLSMPGGIEGLFNIFEVDSQTMSYDKEAMAADIEQYGLFTYEEFAEILPVPEEVFEAVNGQYLKVAIGKGLIDFDTIASYINQYSRLFG